MSYLMMMELDEVQQVYCEVVCDFVLVELVLYVV